MPRRRRIKSVAVVTACVVLILAALVLTAAWLADRALPSYSAQLEALIENQVGQPLSIGGMDLSWTWRGPVLQLTDVAIRDAQGHKTVLQLESLALRFAFVDLVRGITLPYAVAVIGPRLTLVQTAAGGFRLKGFAGTGGSGFGLERVEQLLQQLQSILVRKGHLRIVVNMLESPVVLGDLRLKLSRKHSRYVLTGEAAVVSEHAERIAGKAVLAGGLDWQTADGHLRLRIFDIDVPYMVRGTAGKLRGGLADLEVRVQWQDGAFAHARAALNADAIRYANPGGEAVRIAPPLELRVSANDVATGIRVVVERLTSSAWPSHAIEGVLTIHRDGGRVHGKLTSVPAALAAAGLRLWRPAMLARARVSGSLPRVVFALKSSGDWQLRAQFTGLRVSLPGRSLRTGSLNGRLALDGTGGSIHLATHDTWLAWQPYIRGKLPLTTLSGEFRWQRPGPGIRIELTDLRLAVVGTTVSGGGSLRIPRRGAPIVDVRFELASSNVAPVLEYLPQGDNLPFARLRDWLPKAIRSGHIDKGYVRVQGPLDEFPFADGGGTFEVRLEGGNVTLAYKPGSGWPVLTNLQGRLKLVATTLDIHAQRGQMLGFTVDRGHAHIADIREAILEVQGHVTEVNASALLSVVARSPLEDKFGTLLEKLQVTGPASLKLQLAIPLDPELGEISVHGRVQLAGARLAADPLPQPLRAIRGVLRFDLDGLYADGVSAEFLGMPVTFGFEPASGDGLAVDARARLRLPEDADKLASLLPQPLLNRAQGRCVWHIGFAVAPSGGLSNFRLASDLAGMALDLPAPLGKVADLAVPLTLTLADDLSRAQLDYGQRVNVDARLGRGRVTAMNVIFGGDQAELPTQPGLWVGGKFPVVDIGAWWRFITAFDSQGPAMHLRGARVEAAGLRLRGQRIGGVSVRVLPLVSAHGWLALFEGPGATGSLRWLASGRRGAIDARFEHVAVQLAETEQGNVGDPNPPTQPVPDRAIDPASLPAINLWIGRFRVEDSHLGHLRLIAEPIPHGLAVTRLRLAGNGVKLKVSGKWRRRDGLSSAVIDGELSGDSIAHILQALGYSASLTAEHADVETHLQFAPHPDGLELAALHGELHFTFRDGVLYAVNPGAARVLGLFNFYALPRRLLLDFEDVLSKSLAFDIMTGDLRIEEGIAYIKELRIETPAVTIRIDGRINLATQTYHQKVTLVPKISSTATIAGAVLGGPAVGALIYLVQDLFDRPLSELVSVTYRVTGSWAAPEIKPIGAQSNDD